MGGHFSKKQLDVVDFDWDSVNINSFDVVDFKWPWENLCIEGGGAKAVAFGGTLRVLEIVGALCKIKRFVGSSAGAITATALALGYSANEITDLLFNTDFQQFKDSSILEASTGLLQSYGLHSGAFFFEWIGKLIAKKTGNRDATFTDIYKLFAKDLYITGCNVNVGKTVYFHRKTHPNMPIRQAVRISISIPLLFQPVLFQNDFYVDGGLFDNYPLGCFDGNQPGDRPTTKILKPNTKTLGLKLMSDTDAADDEMYHETFRCDTFINFATALVTHALEEIERSHMTGEFWNRSILVRSGSIKSTDFALSLNTKRDLIRSGCTSATYFLRDWVTAHTNQSRHLSRRGSSSSHSREQSCTGDIPGILDVTDPLTSKSKSNSLKKHLIGKFGNQRTLSREELDKLQRGHEFYLLTSADTRDSVLLSRHKIMDSMVNFKYKAVQIAPNSLLDAIAEYSTATQTVHDANDEKSVTFLET